MQPQNSIELRLAVYGHLWWGLGRLGVNTNMRDHNMSLKNVEGILNLADKADWVFREVQLMPSDDTPLADFLEDEFVVGGLDYMREHNHELLQLIDVAETESVKIRLKSEAVSIARLTGLRLAHLN